MREIPLTQGKVALVDDADFARASAFKQHALRRPSGLFHAVRTLKKREAKRHVYLHRWLVDAPEGSDVDHINGDGLDNRRENLRLCTRRQNSVSWRRVGAKKSSRFHGVCWHKSASRWRAVICAGPRDVRGNSKQIYLGHFRSEDEAARAYDRAAIEHHGAFAITNFPREEYAA